MRLRLCLLFCGMLLIAACQPDAAMTVDGPRLVEERELSATEGAIPTLFVLPTFTPVIVPTSAPPTEAAAVPIATAEQDDFILVTATLQPSKTPTVTPTQTQIPTLTTTPTTTVTTTPTATDDQFTFNGQGQASPQQATAVALGANAGNNPFIQPPPAQQNIAAAQCNETPWWFAGMSNAGPPACPREQPITGHGVFQRFEHGYMLWLESNDKIYVLYSSAGDPQWQIFDDPYIEGEPELDYAWFTYERQPPQTWQPRRGFGEVWRGREDVRFRIGWTVQEWETVYTPRYQRGEDGSVSIEHPDGGVFYMAPRGAYWELYLNR